MQIEKRHRGYVICRGGGGGKRVQYFSFFVDSDSSAWSVFGAREGRNYATIEAAQADLDELRRRARAKRIARRPVNG